MMIDKKGDLTSLWHMASFWDLKQHQEKTADVCMKADNLEIGSL